MITFSVYEKKLTEKVAFFVGDSLSAFMIVENPSFINLLEYVFKLGQRNNSESIDFKNSVPSRKKVKQFIINEQKTNEARILKLLIETSKKHLTVSCDIWTDKSKINSYMDISIFILRDFTIQTFQYKLTYFPVRHTGDNISNLFSEFASSICCTNKKELRIISDSASNMLAGLRDFDNFRCAAHRLNTVISDGNPILKIIKN